LIQVQWSNKKFEKVIKILEKIITDLKHFKKNSRKKYS
jgi:hypothetical protein